jgi:hypothetical protein
MPESLTTLQLAERIAKAVMNAFGEYSADCPVSATRTEAVLRTLHETGHWFCRLTENPLQGTIQQTLPLTEDRRPPEVDG